MPRSLIAPLAFGAVALSWGGGWIASKIGVTAVPPLELSAVRFAIAGVLILALAVATRAPLGTDRIGLIALSAFFGVFGYNALTFVGLTMAPATDGALIVPTLVPVLTAVAATAVGERLTRRKVAGLVIASAGAALIIIAGQQQTELSRERLIGDLLIVGGAACWAVYGAIGTITLRSGSPLGVVGLSTLIGAAMLFPLGFLEHGYRDVPTWSRDAWLAVAYLVVFATFVGFVLFYWAVERFGAATAATVTYLVPVAAVGLAAVVLGERPHPLQLVGAAVILAGVRVATRRVRTPVATAEVAAT